MDDPATATTTGIIAVIAGKAERVPTVTFRIVPPDPISTAVTDSGFLLQAAGTEKLITELKQIRPVHLPQAHGTLTSFFHWFYLHNKNIPERFCSLRVFYRDNM